MTNSRKSDKASSRRGSAKQNADDAIHPRARPVILAAQALKFLRESEPGTNAANTLHELRGCMDGLHRLIDEMPPRAQKLFDKLDAKVQVLGIRLGKDSHALDAVREELIERVMELGEVLMDALMRPPEEKGGQ